MKSLVGDDKNESKKRKFSSLTLLNLFCLIELSLIGHLLKRTNNVDIAVDKCKETREKVHRLEVDLGGVEHNSTACLELIDEL